MSETIEEFRGLLGKPPSVELFAELRKHIDTMKRELSEIELEYLRGNLQHWPASIERMTSEGWRGTRLQGLCNATSGEYIEQLQSRPAAHVSGLQHIDLSSLGLLSKDMHAFKRWEGLSRIRTLNLSLNLIHDEGLETLVSTPRVSHISRLDLVDCDLTAKGVEALLSSPHLSNLKVLNLRHNAIGPEGARALANSERASQLEWLYLSAEDVKKSGLNALCNNDTFSIPLQAYFKALRQTCN